MLHHIYPKNRSGNGVSVYGREIDEIIGDGAGLPEADIWHFELSYTGTDELWAAEAFRRAHPGAPYVLTLHDPPVVCGKPFNRYIASGNVAAKIVRKCLDLTLGRRLIRRVVRGARAVIVLNELAKPVVAQRFGLDPGRIVALPLLPSLAPPPAAAAPWPHEPLQILFFGILTPRKGVEDLVAAFAQATTAADNTRLVIFGGAHDAGYEARLKAEAERLKLAGRVAFTGYGDDAALEAAILASAVVVLPYRTTDIIHASAPLITALAFGRAVIASDVPIFRNELAGGGVGLMFPPRDVPALAECLRRLIAHPDEAERLGRAAAEHIQTAHNPDIIKQQLLKVYKSL